MPSHTLPQKPSIQKTLTSEVPLELPQKGPLSFREPTAIAALLLLALLPEPKAAWELSDLEISVSRSAM